MSKLNSSIMFAVSSAAVGLSAYNIKQLRKQKALYTKAEYYALLGLSGVGVVGNTVLSALSVKELLND